ncbi:bifunctional riboflavin kinase/FMN adenylyltransferase [Bifidobacterium imperatoris]|uniref:Bifunctional riboflavin kinase/FMN adenylyltransferase n=1 Tax=Bifidobacterium imperatoris TaxID=2020965 RepID=A0A2N5ISC7_9BIFI|nr:riboflavin kinase [Bifidobacterium imperatoris]PLS24876.1 bifunctional riboflavin kinase/FMN adenylyltransferase [Bifidobacterium imperatoris]QSY56824.1 bifunctional riboflavin kinase/FMN adenylyltransferase [Bifidobacterium imperatoris]
MEITYLTPDEQGEVAWPSFDNDKKAVVTLGAFDGMHLGHQAVIKRVVELAKKHDSFSVVILFEPRPAFVHGWAAKHDGQEPTEANIDAEALTSVHERLQRIEQLGVDHVLVVRYTLAFASKSYIFFLGRLVGKLGMRTLVLGQDAALGKDRAGDIKHIANLAAGAGVFELDVVDDRGPGEVRIPRDFKPQMPSEWGEPADPLAGLSKAERRSWSKKHQAKAMRAWSSTNVRYLLAHGRIQEANAILGAPHAIEGEVVHGEERGRTIGFPTANLGTDIEGYIPVDGVYAGWLVDLGVKNADSSERPETDASPEEQSARRWPAAISIGTKPTFSEKTGLNERVVESYCITDDWLDLYGHKVRVEFTGFLRPQVKFDGVDALTAELKRNVEETKRLTA